MNIFTKMRGKTLLLTLLFTVFTVFTAYAQEPIDGLTYNTAGGFYEISDASSLAALSTYVSNHDAIGKTFKMTDNINMTGVTNYQPIGNNSYQFKGHFDGQGKTISNLIYDGTYQCGLFSYLGAGGIVERVVLSNSSITGITSVSGIVANNIGGIVRNCNVSSSVIINCQNRWSGQHGGIVAHNEGGTVIGCTCAATVQLVEEKNSQTNMGGIVGLNEASGIVENCLYNGTLVDGQYSYGAIVGGNNGSGATIRNCYFTVPTVANGNAVGNNSGTITNSGLARTITLESNVYINPTGAATEVYTCGQLIAYTFAGGYALDYTGTTPNILYSAEGANISLKYDNLPDGCSATFSYNDGTNHIIAGNSFTMPASNVSVSAVLTKTLSVTGYGSNDGKWVLIASPMVENLQPSEVTNLIGSQIPNSSLYDYDLYRFNQSGSNGEWENYHQHTEGFNLVNGYGYLYARKNDVTLTFTGTPNTDNSKTVNLAYDNVAPHAGTRGFNLVGNPFPVNAYANKSYYIMNEAGTDIVPVSNYANTAIGPCTGIMVQATATGQSVTFTKTASTKTADKGSLQMALVKNGNRGDEIQDKAVVSFDENAQLEKFIFNVDNAKLFIPQNGKDYAIAYSNGHGTMPINFKAKEMGRYTISFETKDLDLSYLHLIDRFTGENIDLLLDNEYSFIASNNDSESRFILSFGPSTGSANDSNFAFQNGDDIIVSGNGELQIFDITGRMIATQRIDGVETIAKPSQTGVYIMKLNDNTQKIVVR